MDPDAVYEEAIQPLESGDTVLLFTGLDDEALPAVEVCRIAEQIEQTYPGLAKARVVTAERFADHPAALGDPTRSAHRQYGVASACAFVVRPDKYIGYRSRPVEVDRLMADLAKRLVPQHLSDKERQLQ